MPAAFDTAAIVRDLEAADMDRRQAEAIAAACHKAATAAQPVTPAQMDAGLAALETRLTNRLYAVAGAIIGAVVASAVALAVAVLQALPGP